MKTYLECLPCFLRQTVEAAAMVLDDEDQQIAVMREVMRRASGMDMRESPPSMGRFIHRQIRALSGEPDPYREVKETFNALALSLYPELKATVQASDAPLETAVRLAIAGNIIDSGVTANLDESHVHAAVAEALSAPRPGNIDAFAAAVAEAGSILYLADNAGEIVFDRLLVEELPLEKVTLVVRGAPILNDATRADAEYAGLTGIVRVIDNGCDAPGTLIEDCGAAFAAAFASADLLISKGQGNYETVSQAEKNIFFLLRAKCPVIARDIGCEQHDMLLLHRDNRPAAQETGRG
jgi:damage-control phosphatase, subfamily I